MDFLREYTLLGELGKGGFAKVYKVRHNEYGYIRAIRVLNEPIADEKNITYQKFLKECKVLLRLGNGSHRNIVHIYQPRLLENHALVEMDYVDGKDISNYLSDNDNFLPVDEVIRMAEEISSALAYCHEDIYKFCIDPDEDNLECDPVNGQKYLIDDSTRKRLIKKYKVIHNDIHSGNIMRREDGSFVLLDFGLAITGDDDVRNSSRHENGAVEFKAPEKWENDEILTEQSDIYSFGIVMYEYLTGRVPFPFDKTDSNKIKAAFMLGEAHKTQAPPPIHVLRKAYYEAKYPGKKYEIDYPEWLEEIIMKCLEKNPTKRFRNGKELNNCVKEHLGNGTITKEAFQNLSNENVTLKNEQQHILAQVTDLTKKNQDLTISNDAVSKELDHTRKELEKAKNTNNNKVFPIVLCVLMGIVAIVFGTLYFSSNGEGSGASHQLKTENENLKKSNQELQQKVTNLQNKSGQTSDNGELSKAKETITILNNQIKGLNKEITDLKTQSGSSSREKELESQLKQANSNVTSLKKERDNLQKEVDALIKNCL